MYRLIAYKLLCLVALASGLGCGPDRKMYQQLHSSDSKSKFVVYEFTGGDAPTLELSIYHDEQQIFDRLYFGRKRWKGNDIVFAIRRLVNKYDLLYVTSEPNRVLAAVDIDTNAVWFASNSKESEYMYKAIPALEPNTTLTDFNSVYVFDIAKKQRGRVGSPQ